MKHKKYIDPNNFLFLKKEPPLPQPERDNYHTQSEYLKRHSLKDTLITTLERMKNENKTIKANEQQETEERN